MRVYSRIRNLLATHNDLLIKYEQLEIKIADHDNSIMLILGYIKQFEEIRQNEEKQKNRTKIGFKTRE